MNEFMSNLEKKSNKKVLAIFAFGLGFLSFLVGILTICSDGRDGCMAFINEMITAVLLLVLGYEIYKERKLNVMILFFALIAEFIFISFGYGVQALITSGDARQMGVGGLEVAIFVLTGLAAILMFLASIMVLLFALNGIFRKPIFHFVSNCIFFIAAILYFIVGILYICEKGDGLALAVQFMLCLFYAVQAVFFALESGKLAIEK